MSTQTITEFLEARIAEDEADARAATTGPWEAFRRGDPDGPFGVCSEYAGDISPDVFEGGTRADAEHIARHDPARVLAECAAKRAIMSHYTETVKLARDPDCPAVQSYSDIAVGLGESLRHLASVYKDHPDYRQEWKL